MSSKGDALIGKLFLSCDMESAAFTVKYQGEVLGRIENGDKPLYLCRLFSFITGDPVCCELMSLDWGALGGARFYDDAESWHQAYADFARPKP